MIRPEQAAQLANLEIVARQIVEGFLVGLHRSPYQGFSVEFSEYRPYQQGEGLDKVDWRVFARSERLYTRRYEEETNLQAYLLIDTSGSMHYPLKSPYTKLDYALFLGAALAYLLIQQRDAVGLYVFDENIQYVLPARARRTWLRRILLELESLRKRISGGRLTMLPQVMGVVAERLRRRSLILLLSDGFVLPENEGAFMRGLARLRHDGHEVIFFRIWDEKTERRFELPLEPLRLIDIESRREVKIHPLEMQLLYQSHFQTWENRLKTFCIRQRIDWVEVDLASDFFEPLRRYLLKRQRMS
ncbi:MAG: DUF58 domain-containing protein [Bacteroidia bacterium]|nr:DUF58 domain-containing protein [Bacteroidia bacterium]MCX7652944.1 DUF58 domain-containing protein [Bacteroidia bacterium]MDW8416588.1 DUF58 domain-containing protein [Bacteroidia bacterium]